MARQGWLLGAVRWVLLIIGVACDGNKVGEPIESISQVETGGTTSRQNTTGGTGGSSFEGSGGNATSGGTASQPAGGTSATGGSSFEGSDGNATSGGTTSQPIGGTSATGGSSFEGIGGIATSGGTTSQPTGGTSATGGSSFEGIGGIATSGGTTSQPIGGTSATGGSSFEGIGGIAPRGGAPLGGTGGAAITGGTSSNTGGAGNGGSGTTPDAAIPWCGATPANILERRCYDFSDKAQETAFNSDAGKWSVVDGQYQADALALVQCGSKVADHISSLVNDLTATDVRVRVVMNAVSYPDKLLILRDDGAGNRIILNFRAYFQQGTETWGGDFLVQERINCDDMIRDGTATGSLPYQIGKPLEVDVTLVGSWLTVLVNSLPIYSRSVQFTRTGPGLVGVGTIGGRVDTVSFDNLIIDVLK